MEKGSTSRLTSSIGDNATSYADSTIMDSPGDDATCYDVFLSFRGEDTRDSFTDHLHEALRRAGFLTFRDDDEIDKGRELKPEIQRAIKASKASIVVLSEHYATSTWCLEELSLILEQRREFNHFVLPVFYHVDPSDVRKQEKTFKIDVKASSKWTPNNVNRWKAALTKVADLTGFVLSGLETKFLKEVVDTIYNELECKKVHLPPDLTGMNFRYEEITPLLNQANFQYLAICGMAGSGKTTLAKYIYNSNWKRFENMSFLEDIHSRCKGPHGLHELQEQLLKDILGGRKRKIPSVSHGTCKIEEALQKKRALIVLDDIAEYSELVALLGIGKINAESKIIITTESSYLWSKFSSRCQQYQMKLLNDDESLELFSCHAFGSKVPVEDLKELATQAARYCEGNPLAIEVLGSSLSNCMTIPYWKSQLEVLKKDIHSRIHDVLERSYNSLPYNSEKELFLHIACFFVGKDMDYVAKILEPDYSAVSGIKTLINRFLLSISSSNKLMMHRLLQEMGRNIVRKESFKLPEKRSRVWHSAESYKILKKGKGSKTIEGLALDMQMLKEEDDTITVNYKPFVKFCPKIQVLQKNSFFRVTYEYDICPMSLNLKTDAFKKMDKLKLLQLGVVELTGSYESFSEDLRWLCWFRFHLRTIPSDLFMGNLVAIDLSYSSLEVFEPPMVLRSLQILNLKDSHSLLEIRNISRIPHLETLILWNCHSLVRVCETIGDLAGLALLNMTGCINLCKEQLNLLVGQEASTSSGQGIVYLSSYRYYDHLKNLRVLDLSLCLRLKLLLCLPSTLAELYVYYCESLEMITFQSHLFTLQEFGYEGCISLSEIEGFIKLIPIAKLDETDLGHMKWLKEYQNHKMLYEFNIMSTSLPDIKDLNTHPEHISESTYLCFDVPSCPKNKRLKGLNVTFKYTLYGDYWAWFAKVSTTNGVDLMYNPKVFGNPGFGEVGIWLSYWPIGNKLDVGDKVNVSIVGLRGLVVRECGASLVYADDEEADETLEKNMGWAEALGGDLSGFQLSTGAYYLCRHDFLELMQRLHMMKFLLSHIDLEVRGWRKTGRPKQSNPSFTELKTVRCIIDGPELEEIYNIAGMSKSSSIDKIVEFTSTILRETIESGSTSEVSDATTKEYSGQLQSRDYGMSKAFVLGETTEKSKLAVTDEDIKQICISFQIHFFNPTYFFDNYCPHFQVVLAVNFTSEAMKDLVVKMVSELKGVDSVVVDLQEGRLTVIGEVDPKKVLSCVKQIDKHAYNITKPKPKKNTSHSHMIYIQRDLNHVP
ncbi:hypothetical protein OSB04_015460 [Centaurea solstitialis]|uniref:TIR domain-containing protein n=1 Tax=Centaurea solstitialis TaxID=347529 RepID=A0AA38SZ45_9ASTR|nr:hypothetical protein OSB04_015460 [Centaurea solstitialis]